MPLVILHHLLNVFVQLANKRGFTKKKKNVFLQQNLQIFNFKSQVKKVLGHFNYIDQKLINLKLTIRRTRNIILILHVFTGRWPVKTKTCGVSCLTLWHVDTLQGNASEISSYTAVVAK
jgi:hypothetical protein